MEVPCSTVHSQDGLDESISQSTTFLTEGGVTGGGAYGDGLSSDQLDNLSEMKLREAQVYIIVHTGTYSVYAASHDCHMTRLLDCWSCWNWVLSEILSAMCPNSITS